jgi:hypothetical protein
MPSFFLPLCAFAVADAEQARYGGHPELVALSEVLRVRVDIYDVGGASGLMTTYHLGEMLPDGVPVVRGIRKGLHFNLLLQAAAEGEALAPPLASGEGEGEAAELCDVD